MDHHEAAVEICKILLILETPRKAALAVAIVRANLFAAGGAETHEDVRKMIADDDAAALSIWQAVHALKN